MFFVSLLTEWTWYPTLFDTPLNALRSTAIWLSVFLFITYLVCLFAFILALNLLTWFAHRQNVKRLFAGEEHHTSFKKRAKKSVN